MRARKKIAAWCVGVLVLTGAWVGAQGLPDGGLTILGGSTDDGLQGGVDALLPVWSNENQLLFLDARGSTDDESQQDASLGLGFRALLPDSDLILGANLFYDSLWTEHDNQFNQIGLGLEVLSEWVDGRVNYYLPEDDAEDTNG